MTEIEQTPLGIWTCKIGNGPIDPRGGLDSSMRHAVAQAFRDVTGQEAEFIFSGWRGELTEQERAVVEDRLPVEGVTTVEIKKVELDALRAADRKLDALEAAGVDNWEGYDDAMSDFYGDSK